MLDLATIGMPRYLAGLFFLSSLSGVPLQSQAPNASLTPPSWLQLRGGTDNGGVVKGTLEVSWSYKAPRPVRGIAVAADMVVMGTESADADAKPGGFARDQRGFLIALDARTGLERWTVAVPSWIHGDPAVYGGYAIASYGRWPMTHPGGVSATDLRTGKVKWSLQTEAGIMPAPAIDSIGRAAIVIGGDGVLFGLSLADGTVLYRAGLRSADGMSSPRIDGETVFVGAGESVSSYSIRQAKLNWRFQTASLKALGDVPVAIADNVIFTTGTKPLGFLNALHRLTIGAFLRLSREALRTKSVSNYRGWFQEQWLVAIQKRNGHLLWRRALGIGLEVPRNTSGTPVVAQNRVFVSSPVSKMVWAFDVGSGFPLWSLQLEWSHKGAVTVIANDVVIGDSHGWVTLLRAADGAVIGRCILGAPFTPLAPVLVGKTLFIATRDGWVHATPYDSLRGRAMRGRAASCL